MFIRSKNEVHVRGEIKSDVEEIRDGYLFTITTEARHDGKVYKTDFEVWAGHKLKPILGKSKRGHTVDIEGPLSNNHRIIAVDFNNVTLEQEWVQERAKQEPAFREDDTP